MEGSRDRVIEWRALETEWTDGDRVEWSGRTECVQSCTLVGPQSVRTKGTYEECVVEVHGHKVRQTDRRKVRHADG